MVSEAFYIDVGFQRPRGAHALAYDEEQRCLKSECRNKVPNGVAWCQKHLEKLRGGES